MTTTEHRTLTALAKAIGFSTPICSQWRKKYPDCPATLVEQDWREFIARNGLGLVGNRTSKSREALLTEKVASEVRLNHIKIAQAERKLIPAGDVDSFLLHIAASTKAALYQMTSELPPKLAGLETAEIRRLMREHADVICVEMQGLHDTWSQEQEEAQEAAATQSRASSETPAHAHAR